MGNRSRGSTCLGGEIGWRGDTRWRERPRWGSCRSCINEGILWVPRNLDEPVSVADESSRIRRWEVHVGPLPRVDALLCGNYEANKKNEKRGNVPRGGVLANVSILLRTSTITSVDSPESVGIASSTDSHSLTVSNLGCECCPMTQVQHPVLLRGDYRNLLRASIHAVTYGITWSSLIRASLKRKEKRGPLFQPRAAVVVEQTQHLARTVCARATKFWESCLVPPPGHAATQKLQSRF